MALVTNTPPKPPLRSLLQRTARPTARPELRRTPRFKVAASVLLDHAGATARLTVLNVSATGALIATTPDGPILRAGTLLFISLSMEGAPSRKVDVDARVVRLSETETALDWSEDPPTVDAVGALLLATQQPPPLPRR